MRKTLKSTLAKNLAIGAIGLTLAFDMLEYNTAIMMSLSEKFQETALTPKNLEEMNKLYISAIDKVQDIQNAAIEIGGASRLYLIFGLSIPLAGYAMKRK
jgi:hypothetical protein